MSDNDGLDWGGSDKERWSYWRKRCQGWHICFCLENLGSWLCHLMRTITLWEEHIWDRKSQESKNYVLDMSWSRCSWSIRVEVVGNHWIIWISSSQDIGAGNLSLGILKYVENTRSHRSVWASLRRGQDAKNLRNSNVKKSQQQKLRSRSKGVKEEIVML